MYSLLDRNVIFAFVLTISVALTSSGASYVAQNIQTYSVNTIGVGLTSFAAKSLFDDISAANSAKDYAITLAQTNHLDPKWGSDPLLSIRKKCIVFTRNDSLAATRCVVDTMLECESFMRNELYIDSLAGGEIWSDKHPTIILRESGDSQFFRTFESWIIQSLNDIHIMLKRPTLYIFEKKHTGDTTLDFCGNHSLSNIYKEQEREIDETNKISDVRMIHYLRYIENMYGYSTAETMRKPEPVNTSSWSLISDYFEMMFGECSPPVVVMNILSRISAYILRFNAFIYRITIYVLDLVL